MRIPQSASAAFGVRQSVHESLRDPDRRCRRRISRGIRGWIAGVIAPALVLVSAADSRAECSDYRHAMHWLSGTSFWEYTPGGNSAGMTAIGADGARVLAYDEQRGLLAFEEVLPGHLDLASGLSEVVAEAVHVAGDRAYAASYGGFTVIDIQDIDDMSVVAALPVFGPDLDVEGGYAYVVTYGEVTVIDVRERGRFPVVGHLAGEVRDLVVRGNRVYVIDPGGLRVADVSDPADPFYLPAEFPASPLLEIAIQGDRLYATRGGSPGSAGLFVLDLSNPDVPALESFTAVPVGGLAVGEGIALVGTTYLDTGNPEAPVVRGTYPGLESWGAVVSRGLVEGIAYVAAGHLGIQSIALAGGEIPGPIASLPASAHGVDLHVSGSVLTVLVRHELQTIDISNPGAPVEIGSVPVIFGESMCVLGSHAFVLDSSDDIRVVDLTVPSQPKEIGSIPVSGARYLAGDAGRLYTLSSQGGLTILDVGNPPQPVVLGETSIPWIGDPVAIAVLGTDVYIAAGFESTGFLNRFDASDPQDVQWVEETLFYSNDIQDIDLAAGRLFVSTRTAIHAVDPLDLGSRVSIGDHSFSGEIHAAPDGGVYTVNIRGGLSVARYDGDLSYIGTGNTGAPTDYRAGIESKDGWVFVSDRDALRVFAPPCAPASTADDSRIAGSVDGNTPVLAAQPNPFIQATTLLCRLDAPVLVDLRVFDAGGRHVRTLVHGRMASGETRVTWDGCDDRGRPLPAGVFFVRMGLPGASRVARVHRMR